MRRTFVLFGTLLILWMLVTQLNHALAPLRVHLFVHAPFITFAALTQPRRAGLAASMLAGLVCDAHAPVAFGTHLLLFAAAHLMLFHIRERVPRDDAISAVIVALLTNLALFIVFSIIQLQSSPAPAALWPRLLFDLLCSQVFLVLLTPWFVALQARSLALARVQREEAA